MLSTAPHHPFITIFATTIAIARHCNIRRRRKIWGGRSEKQMPWRITFFLAQLGILQRYGLSSYSLLCASGYEMLTAIW